MAKIIEDAIKYLDEEGYLKYGARIPREVLERILKVDYDPNDWTWIGKVLKLKMSLEKEGFFSTQRGEFEGDMRILPLEDMPKRVNQIIDTIISRQKRTIEALKNADTELLENQERAEHMNALLRIMMTVNSRKSLLGDIDY